MPIQNVKVASSAIGRDELPPLDLLRSFEASARHLSFTLAAQELFLTQSAVSRQIQQMESWLGVALFERRHRALVLTEAGAVMQRAAVDALERLRDATARVRAAPALRQVAMTCTPGFASLWLIPRLARFTEQHPDVDVRISATLELLDLERSQLDLAVRFCPTEDGHGQPLFEEWVVPMCSPRLADNSANPLLQPADLVRHTLLAVDQHPGMPLTVEWEPWARLMGVSEVRMKNTVRFTQYADAVAAAMQGQGVVIGRLPLLAELVDSGRLVTPFGSCAASQRGYYVVPSARGAVNPDAQDFVRWLRSEAEAALAPQAAMA
ncbi:DNA-binding transcriptional LysR family regulator [Acidovorax soli]|uniref:DNA-binding transcriptional LysR family regulator n=1 Tax=Acidovorax soli TaxID=592050 RepID=A0A7X0PBJ2_9BURK|nr:LysR substrate-binding domain-containing protein [Acidovorax soli]MBB6558589.1 DNA-binding transcriptional LysR family regulator [Acidovorax soli]